MKRLFSILISSLFFATSAWAVTTQHINSYATRTSVLNGGVVTDDRTVDVKFYVMAPTKGVWVYLDMNEDGVLDGEDINIYANENLDATAGSGNWYDYETVTCTIPDNVPVGEYKWLVKVRGAQDHSTWTTPQVVRDYARDDYRYSFSRAMGVAVDCSYESEYLGYSYVTETHYQRNAWGNTNSTKTDGVYMFGPAMGKVFNSASGSYGAYNNTGSTIKCNALNTSSYAFGRDDEASTKYYLEYSPARLCTDKDGYVYICENVPAADRTAKVFRMDPANPTKQFEVVLTTRHIEAAAMAIKGNVDGLPKRVQSATVVTDEQGNKLLYAILGTVEDKLIYQSVCLCVFNINDLKNVTYAGKYKSLYQFDCAISSTKQILINVYNQIVPGKNGDVWIFQSREAEDAAYSGTIHLDKNLNCDFIIPTTGTASTDRPVAINMRGSGAINHDGSILAVPTSATHITFYNVNYKASDKSSVESLTVKCQMTSRPEVLSSGEKHMVDAMAFDVADNIYFTVNVGTYPNDPITSNKPKGRLYVYALPKADNSHVTPARSSLRIRVSEGLTWHPYPDGYNVTNADLQAMFNADRANWNGTLTDFMTSSTSKWKWLGDYIAEITNANAKLPDDMNTNDKLWGSYDPNKAPWDGFKKYYNDYHNVSRSNMEIGEVATFLYITNAATTRKKVYDILTNTNSEYKWLGDYILEVAKEQKISVSQDGSEWNWILHGFFNKDNKTSSTKSGTLTHGFNFTEAGKPDNWGPAYLAANGGYTPLKTDADWQTQLNNFFNATGVYATAGQSDQAHNGANGWYNEWWNANFPSAMVNAVAFPTVKRVGHVQNGWYYGGSEGYESAAREMSGAVQHSGHIWARWLEVGLYEGYLSVNNSNVTEFSSEEKTIKEVNRNIELINLLAGQEVAIKIDRKLVGGMYNTMCLPFDIAGKEAFSQIVYADGSGSPFAKVGGVYPFSLVKYVGTQAGENELILDFDELGDTETLSANTPFLLKPNADITKPLKYNAARISGGGAQPASDEGDNEEDNEEGANIAGQNYGITVGDGDEYFTYTGVLAPTTIPDGSVLLVADNRLAQSTGGEMKGMRGFFNMKLAAHNMPMALRITSKEGVTTYLDAVDMSTQSKNATKILYNGKIYILRDGKVYTITGTRVK